MLSKRADAIVAGWLKHIGAKARETLPHKWAQNVALQCSRND
jgi:hypothetical protein